jgi:deoxyribose-phosphate aldolase
MSDSAQLESPAAAPPDAQQLNALVRLISQEILRYLGAPMEAPPGCEIEDLICAGCEQCCIERCAAKTQRVIAAGADRISAGAGVQQFDASLAHLIDHTLLKPEASRADVLKLCREAAQFGFASVCVNPWYVPLVAEQLRGTPVKVCTVIGFPLGATLPRAKIFEAEEALKLGAQELDMVLNIGALKSGQDDAVELDIRGVVQAAHRGGAICKVILETALLTDAEKVRACVAAKNAGADFVKTSTGFGPGGATAEDVALLRAVVGTEMGVKASGGVRSLEDLKKMVRAGATRIGASASVRILEEACGSAKPAAPPASQPAVARY